MLKSFLAVLVVANLAVPERIVRYGDCCYDQNGNLNAAHFQQNKQERIHGPSCCDPVEYKFRAASSAPVQTAAHIDTVDAKVACFVSHIDYSIVCISDRTAETLRFNLHGPPRALWQPELTTRLNI